MNKGMALQFKVTNQTIERLDSYQVYEKSQGYLYAQFIFSEDWKGYNKTIKFSNVLTDAYIGVTLGNDNMCIVPHTLILYPAMSICIEGVKGTNIITTNSIAIDVDKSESTTPHIDTPITEITSSDGSIEPTKDDFRVDLKVSDSIYMRYGTYDQLASLKNQSHLVKGMKYRLLGYKTVINGKINNVNGLARSQEHPFDLILTATSEDTFSEEVNALPTEGDTYFTNSNLKAWKLWYCFDNDENRFEWASPQGQGVIYRMIDEFNNDIPYDFKNIQFKRYKITGTTDARQSDFIGKYYAFDGSYGLTYDTTDFTWNYTCCDTIGNDLSIQNVNDPNWDNCRYTKELKIDEYLSDAPTYRGKQALNDIVLISPSIIVDIKFGEGSTKNTFIGNEDMTYSYFKEMCRRNIICGELSHNRGDECFQDNLIGTGVNTDETFHFVRTARHFENNIIIKMTSTTFKDAAYNNVFANNVQSCAFTSIVNSNDYSGLNIMQYCDIYRSYNTKIYGSGKWLYVRVKAFESCEFHIDNLYGSTFDFLQRVTLSKNTVPTLSILSMEFDTILGSPTTIDLSALIPYNINGSRSFKRLCGARIDNVNGNRFEYTCENIEDGMPKVLGAYSIDDGATWNELKMPIDCYVVTLSDLTIPSGYNPSAGNMTFGWSSNEKITFSESLAKLIKETKRPLAINYSILHSLCPSYYTNSASYDYIIFYPSSSRCYKEQLAETYEIDELITYESLEETQSVLGDFVNTSYKIGFYFNKAVDTDVQNPKETLDDVYSCMLFFERNLKFKSLYNFVDIYSSDFNKLKYNGSVTIRANYNLYNIGANEVMVGIAVYEPNGSTDLETMVTFTRPTGMVNMYCTSVLLFYDFYIKADYLCTENASYVTLTRMDKPTYTVRLTDFTRYAQNNSVEGWDALDIGTLEFVFSKDKMDAFVTKMTTIVNTYYPTLETPQNMMDVINVLNNLFNISKGYADASSPVIPFAFCQLIASADSVTNVNITSTKVVAHTVQTSCNLDNNEISIICFSDFAGTLGGETLVEDSTHYYRLSGNWTIS